MVETGGGQTGLDGVLHVGAQVRFRQLGGKGSEAGVGFQGELVAGQVLGLQLKGGFQVVDDMPSVEQLAKALNALGVSSREMMAIFQSLKRAGALQAEVVIN